VSVGERVRALREERGLTQEQLAVHAGCSSSTLKRLEVDGLVPKLAILEAIAGQLETTAAALIDDRRAS
jgi:transcriptional regulator with XRE-family HTH domain